MVRQVKVDDIDGAARPIVAVANDYPDGHVIPPHWHRRGQLLCSDTGTLVVSTQEGNWVMPPQRGLWIPPGAVHHVHAIGAVALRSVLVEPSDTAGMPVSCQVVSISPLLRSLLSEALEMALLYDSEGRDGALVTLLQHELRRLPVLPLSLPMPRRADLAARCRTFLRAPSSHEAIDAWCKDLRLSRRSFTRLFRSETGLSFVEWRQQACLLAALRRLAAGESVTAVAMVLGYDNPAAFTAMFKRHLGVSPRNYLAE